MWGRFPFLEIRTLKILKFNFKYIPFECEKKEQILHFANTMPQDERLDKIDSAHKITFFECFRGSF